LRQSGGIIKATKPHDDHLYALYQRLLRQWGGLFRASKPHDHLYALLGLPGMDEIPRDLYPDYTLPFEQVFHLYAIYLINNLNDISFLSSTTRKLLGVPSWVPDWCFVANEEDQLSHMYLDSPYIRITAEGSCLEIDGIVLGRITNFIQPTQIEANLENTGLYRAEDGEANIAWRERLALASFRAMQQLQKTCTREIHAAGAAISIEDFQHHLEIF
jgi:hypothetical protein